MYWEAYKHKLWFFSWKGARNSSFDATNFIVQLKIYRPQLLFCECLRNLCVILTAMPPFLSKDEIFFLQFLPFLACILAVGIRKMGWCGCCSSNQKASCIRISSGADYSFMTLGYCFDECNLCNWATKVTTVGLEGAIDCLVT